MPTIFFQTIFDEALSRFIEEIIKSALRHVRISTSPPQPNGRVQRKI